MTIRLSLKNWEMIPPRKENGEEDTEALRGFAQFLANKGETEIEMPKGTKLNGKIAKAEVDEESFSSYGGRIVNLSVKIVKRIKGEDHSGTSRDLMCATIEDGKECDFYSDEYIINTKVLLENLTK